ncbi:restriction endonuclease subunit S [Roseicyclus marinus]|uniref:restriction endonuclease subunit S n=1 Tax=Roseicyclus marinus TaxID=2161673 RepID=UPI00240F5BF5|nr:restriction endonuclease subunit S [Roseicyclus marinus]MDG3040713.1 restriction endonuclease subunit S [Roseicyclus marinus]
MREHELTIEELLPKTGWAKIKLGELGVFVKGKGIARSDVCEEGYPCLRYGEIYSTYETVTTGLVSKVSPSAADQACALEHGDIVFAASGETAEEIGKVVTYTGKERAWVGGDTVILRGHGQNAVFLAHALNSDPVVRQKARLGKGQSVVHIHAPDLATVEVLLPPLPEQLKIAAILRTWDEALEKLSALRALNIRRRIWLRTHLFTGKARLHGFTGEWCKVPLSDVLHEHGSKSTGAEEVYSVSVHKGLVNQVEHLGRSFSAASTDHYNRVLPGDIVYTKSPTGDFPLGIIKQSKIDREVIVSPLYGVYTPQSYALGVILDALFESPLAARNYLHPLVQKGAKNTIAVTNKQFLEGKLHLPMDPDEQAAIADVVNASHAELACLDAEIKALTDQKRGLMQKLLTGEWRVEVSDDEEAAA